MLDSSFIHFRVCSPAEALEFYLHTRWRDAEALGYVGYAFVTSQHSRHYFALVISAPSALFFFFSAFDFRDLFLHVGEPYGEFVFQFFELLDIHWLLTIRFRQRRIALLLFAGSLRSAVPDLAVRRSRFGEFGRPKNNFTFPVDITQR